MGKKIESARRKAIKKGDEIILVLKQIISELPKKQQDKIDIIRWDDVKTNDYYEDFLLKLKKEFNENKEFKECILSIIKKHFEKSQVHNSPEIISNLSKYLLDEFPALLHGFYFNNNYYNCYTYPEDNSLTKFVEDICLKKKFPNLHSLVDIRKNISIELRVV